MGGLTVRAGQAVSGEDIWPDPNWRDTQEDPCSCIAGDGTNECERYDECYEAWHRAQAAARAEIEGGGPHEFDLSATALSADATPAASADVGP